MHEVIVFRIHLYEGIEFYKSIFIFRFVIETIFIAVINPPFKLPMITWGQGYGKNDLVYSVSGFVFIFFIITRMFLVGRILQRYSKFRTYKSE